jgi:pSer/pThr/pTyr-binding forkhead associated (FHA) protein
MPECVEAELERRLCLYQTFLKLYEHHGSLLDEIIQLETLQHPLFTGVKSFYLQGVIDTDVVYVTTNLYQGQTVALKQPQRIWTLGRERSNGIHVSIDSYVSRRHAAIYYIDEEQKFYLVDFKSTNGSYVNGERIFQRIELKDGDHIRLGNTTFDFFLNASTRVLPTVALESLMLLDPEEVAITKHLNQEHSPMLEILGRTRYITSGAENITQLLNFEQSQEMIDYFLSKKTPQSLT